ncbi:hypothetical protein [Phytoactinopolyspora limicola]|uniref:hypothetical protein n=1 Tax=Phytoactinopolyspora limicola TaxID=2715536 RepID=UPI00140E106B|nr:hypothetical protein [Phytoactinopolyspora limicola]
MSADPLPADPSPSCLSCGRSMSSDTPIDALAWAAEIRGGRRVWLCPRCTRAHARDIEGKLPADHWL